MKKNKSQRVNGITFLSPSLKKRAYVEFDGDEAIVYTHERKIERERVYSSPHLLSKITDYLGE